MICRHFFLEIGVRLEHEKKMVDFSNKAINADELKKKIAIFSSTCLSFFTYLFGRRIEPYQKMLAIHKKLILRM